MELIIAVKDVYGKRTFYPACEQSIIITEDLLKQKSLTESDIKQLQRLGYKFTIKPLTIEGL